MRRLRVLTMVLLTMPPGSARQAAGGEHLMYVGTYTGKGSDGIYGYRFDPAGGELHTVGLAARTKNPSFLAAHPEGRFLYAVNEVDSFEGQPTGAVSAFSIERASGALTLLQQVSSLGGGPAHVSLDRTSRFLMVANYGGGNVGVFPLGPDGRLGRHTAFMQSRGSGPDPKRQAGPHAHSIQVTTDNRLALVADLGADRLLVYDFDERTGMLTADSLKTRAAAPGAGPRHIAVAPSGRFVYVVNEMTSSVTTFAYDAARGTLKERQTVPTLRADFTGANTAAGIILDSRGRSLYVSNRGDDSIVLFAVDEKSGEPRFVERVPCGGKAPRHIALDPTGTWLFSANQRSDRITLFRVDPENGRLTAASQTIGVVSPVCVTFAPGP
jgi:6-phosphogluconolactonase